MYLWQPLGSEAVTRLEDDYTNLYHVMKHHDYHLDYQRVGERVLRGSSAMGKGK